MYWVLKKSIIKTVLNTGDTSKSQSLLSSGFQYSTVLFVCLLIVFQYSSGFALFLGHFWDRLLLVFSEKMTKILLSIWQCTRTAPYHWVLPCPNVNSAKVRNPGFSFWCSLLKFFWLKGICFLRLQMCFSQCALLFHFEDHLWWKWESFHWMRSVY